MTVVEEFDYLCRLCAAKTGILMGLPIFEAGEQLRNIDKKIAACLPVQVSMTDQLPKVVCEDCAYKLDQLFDFREKVLHTEGMFIEMLKEITKEEVATIERLNAVEDLADIQNNLDMTSNLEIEDIHKHVNSANENAETIHTIVMDEMSLTGGEQVVVQEDMSHRENEIQVTGIDCLDGETVQMVSNHQISMHLDEDMTVVENLTVSDTLGLGINYVTTINPDNSQAQMVHYCEAVAIKNEYQNVSKTLSPHLRNISSATFAVNSKEEASEIHKNGNQSLPSTSQVIIESDRIMVEYTKSTKAALLESVLNNPTIDEMGAAWHVCPFCNDASPDAVSLSTHFDQHFCSCECGVFYTSVEMLDVHKQNCDFANKLPQNSKESRGSKEKLPSEDETKKQPSVRQKWTPKVCNQCGKQYRTNYKLQEHMRKHTGEKPFQCAMCEKAFRSKIGLAQHTATHTGQFDYNCSTCGKGFQCKSYLIVHQRVHSDLKPYRCTTCGQNFKTKQSLLDHENRHLGVKPYMCEICGRRFITKGLCKSHQKIHSDTDNRQYPCVVCNKMFVSKSYLNTHLRIHTGEKPYLCEVCGKGFLTRVDLKIHSTMHTGEKSFKCEVCAKVFARRAALQCHRRSHTGERPYRCDICGKTFTQFSPMAIHKRLHTGERPYECDVCAKTFVSRSTMMCHKKKHNLNAAASATKDGKVNGEPNEQNQVST